ncbi:MAG: HlyD family efflux transporter periplasmic adaptor subunit, partial [Dehalococcoidia bacterium]
NSAQNTLVTAQTALATLQARTDAATQARNTQSRIDAFQAQKTDAESQFAAKLDAIAAQGRSAAAVTAMREAFSTLDRAVAARCNVTANRAPCLAATSSVSNLDALVAQVDAQATSPSPDPEEGETRVTLPGALAKFEASGASADIETLMDSAFYIVQASASLPGLSAQLSARVLAVSTGSSALPPTADEMTNAARTRDAATTSLDAARNGLEAARARRDQLMGGPLPTELALQEQSLAQSEIALNRALNDQRGATLVAPFDGIIGAITMNVGEPSGSGSVILIDPLTMQLNATAQESDVAKLKVGQTVQLTFDAYAGVTLPGTVSTVAPEATVTQGVASYAVAIAVNRQAGSSAAAGSATPSARPTGAAGSATPGARPTGAAGSATPGARPTGAAGSGTPAAGAAGSATPAARATGGTQQAAQNVVLRSGMTGTGDVEIQRHTDVLTVPARAVKRQGRTSVVTVVVGDKQETRTVQTGASDATYVEITSGLNEGDLVALPGSTTGAAAGTATRASTVTTGAGAQGAGGAPPSFGPRPGG